MTTDTHCVQSMYLKPSGDMTVPFDKSAVLVIDTDLVMEQDQTCKDKRLGDLLMSLDDMIEMTRPMRTGVEAVEIRCMVAGKGVETTYKSM